MPCRSKVGLYSEMETLERFQAERNDLVGFMCFCVDSHCRGQGRKEGDLEAIAMIQVRVLCGLGQRGGNGGDSKVVRVWIYLVDPVGFNDSKVFGLST